MRAGEAGAARKLIGTGVLPTKLYGAPATGVGLTEISTWRSRIANAYSPGGGRCVQTRLVLLGQPTHEPHWRALTDVVFNFLQLYTLNPRMRPSLTEQPLRPTEWRSKEGETWSFDVEAAGRYEGKFSLLCIGLGHALRASAQSICWYLASIGRNGGGLAAGLDLKLVRRIDSWLRRVGRTDAALMLRCIQAGGFWDPERKQKAFGEEQQCALCGALCASALHIFWTCPELRCVDAPLVQRSQALVRHAAAGAHSSPALWLRACPALPPAPAARISRK